MIELTQEEYKEYEKIADEIWQGKRGKDYNGKKRKEALGDAYDAVQSIINNKYYKLKNNIKIVDNKTESDDIDWDSVKINKPNTNNNNKADTTVANESNVDTTNNKPNNDTINWDSLKINRVPTQNNNNDATSNKPDYQSESDDLIKIGERKAHVNYNTPIPNEFNMTGNDRTGVIGTFPIYKQTRPRRSNIKLK